MTLAAAPPVEPAVDRAYAMLRRDIINGLLPPATHLAEADLATQYGFSRTPIRESLRRLQAEGLVEVVAHRGARVVDWHNFDVEGIYDLRTLVESFVARRAATRIGNDSLTSLATLCDQMEQLTAQSPAGKAESLSEFAALNDAFHGTVAKCSEADYVAPGRAVLLVLPVIFQALQNYSANDFERSNRHHRELLDAFAAHDPDWAASIMTAHVLSSKMRLLANR